MPFSFEGLFRCQCIPFLRLEVVGATEVVVPGGQNYWVADYSVAPANITIEAYTVLGTHIDWTATSPGALPVHNVTLHHTDRCRIPLDDDHNVVVDGQFITVSATALGLTESVRIVVKPLVTALTVVPGHYAFQDAAGWYGLDLSGIANVNAAQITANLEVTTAPVGAAALSHVQWAAIDTANAGAVYNLTPIDTSHKGISLDNIGTIQTSVALDNSPQPMPAAVTVDIRAPAVNAAVANGLAVELDQFTFAGTGYFGVTQENAGNFNALFPAVWDRGNTSRPQAYAAQTAVPANTTMAANAVTLNVTAQPAGAPTNITVRASAYFPRADGTLTVLRGATAAAAVAAGTAVNTNVAMGIIAFAPDLPNEVMHNNPLLIFWEVNDGTSWFPLQITANTVYVTARPPADTTVDGGANVWTMDLNTGLGSVYTYDSLLAMSCNAVIEFANGSTNAVNVRDAIVQGFALPANGNNPRAQRLNRTALGITAPLALSYWLNYTVDPPAQSVNERGVPLGPLRDGGDLFNNPTGTVACGVWAQMLIAMWALHGKNDGHFIAVWTQVPGGPVPPPMPAARRFLVRNWSYNNQVALNANGFTHAIIGGILEANAPVPDNVGNNRAAPVTDRLAGQNNDTAPPQFQNHFIVRDGGGGDFYDPSYGTPARGKDPWIEESLIGLRNDMTNRAGYAAVVAGQVQPNTDIVALQDRSQVPPVIIP